MSKLLKQIMESRKTPNNKVTPNKIGKKTYLKEPTVLKLEKASQLEGVSSSELMRVFVEQGLVKFDESGRRIKRFNT